jgi:chromosome segregation ATPase
MRNIKPALLVAFLLCTMGVWGCSQQKTGAISAKINELESRHAKLEEDYRTLQSNHDQYRKKLSQMEAQRNALEQEKTELNNQLDKTTNERETLRKQVSQRTQERDVAQTNLTQFSKELQALAGRVESALNNNSPGPNASIIPASRRTE